MVNSLRHKTLSLSGHFTVYLTGMLLLILFLLGNSWLTLKSTITHYNDLADRELLEIRHLVALRDSTLASVEPIYNYLAWGSPHESGLFEQRADDVEAAFEDILRLPTVTEQQRQLLTNARDEWKAALNVARAIFMITKQSPVDTDHLVDASAMFQNHITTVSSMLFESQNLRIASIDEYRQIVSSRHQLMTVVMFLCFAGALLIFSIASLTLSRHVLRPLRLLNEGIARYGNGELSHRIEHDAHNELGELARGINEMATRLEHDQIALANLAIRDSLTNLYNRREFERLLEDELHRAQRYLHPLSMLLIDVDNFKLINDSYGHLAGDLALQMVSTVINAISRKGDVVGRIGGDELAVLLPETPIEEAMILAERIRKQITRHTLPGDDSDKLQLTLSIGVATTSNEIITTRQLFDAADRAMYLAKTGGRNRVRRLEPGGDPLPLALPR